MILTLIDKYLDILPQNITFTTIFSSTKEKITIKNFSKQKKSYLTFKTILK